MTDRAAVLRCMVIGDIIGKPGRLAVVGGLRDLRAELDLDLVIANGENLAAGAGLTPSLSEELLASGVDVITSGNHIWDKREIYDYLDSGRPVLRPLNYPDDAPGRGWLLHTLPDGDRVAVINVMGRVFMNQLDSPFAAMDSLLDGAAEPLPPLRIVDFHCEITSEKNAMGWYLDGRVTAVLGTHTHVPTADARLLPKGTAYISDVGMTGPRDSVIGFSLETVLPRFLTHLPTRFAVADGPVSFNAVVIEAERTSGGRWGRPPRAEPGHPRRSPRSSARPAPARRPSPWPWRIACRSKSWLRTRGRSTAAWRSAPPGRMPRRSQRFGTTSSTWLLPASHSAWRIGRRRRVDCCRRSRGGAASRCWSGGADSTSTRSWTDMPSTARLSRRSARSWPASWRRWESGRWWSGYVGLTQRPRSGSTSATRAA
jgi:metallophosphoesterase (TIGR00282 family)